MRRQTPPVSVSIVLLVIGLFAIYWIFHTNSSASASAGFVAIWQRLSQGSRAIVVVGFILSAYGLGGVLNTLFGGSKEA